MLLCVSQAYCQSLYDRIHRTKTLEEYQTFTKGVCYHLTHIIRLIIEYETITLSMNPEQAYTTK